MRILVCAQEAPLGPVNGFRRQLQGLLSALRHNHTVYVVALLAPDQAGSAAGAADAARDPDLRVVRPPRSWLGLGRPASAADPRWGAPAIYRRAVEWLGPVVAAEAQRFAPDLVYVTGARLAGLWPWCGDSPRVIAPLDAAHLSLQAQAAAGGPARPLLAAAAGRVRRFEAVEYRHYARVLVLSEMDRDAVRAACPTADVVVIPHSVDAGLFAPREWVDRDPMRILFTGVMSAAANVSAAEFLVGEVLPLVRREVPGAHLAIVGRCPPRRILRLRGGPGVEVAGEVADMAGWLSGGWVYAAGMRTGSGVKNKLLEAMACAVPCVATPLALGGLHATPGRDLLVGRTAPELAAHLVDVLRDDVLAGELGAAGRAYVRTWHNRELVGERVSAILAEVVAEHPPAPRAR